MYWSVYNLPLERVYFVVCCNYMLCHWIRNNKYRLLPVIQSHIFFYERNHACQVIPCEFISLIRSYISFTRSLLKIIASMAKLVRRHTSNVEIISSTLVGSIFFCSALGKLTKAAERSIIRKVVNQGNSVWDVTSQIYPSEQPSIIPQLWHYLESDCRRYGMS